MSSADAPDAASRRGDPSDADWHGVDQLSPAGSRAGQPHALTARQSNVAQKHDEASSAGEVLMPDLLSCQTPSHVGFEMARQGRVAGSDHLTSRWVKAMRSLGCRS